MTLQNAFDEQKQKSRRLKSEVEQVQTQLNPQEEMNEILVRHNQALEDQVKAHERERTVMRNRLQSEKDYNSRLVDKIEAIEKIGNALAGPDDTIFVEIPKGITIEEVILSK